jgi:hypothetical protein
MSMGIPIEAGRRTMKHKRDKWEIEDDMRTMARAEEIKKDPKRLKDCQDMAREKMKEMQAVMDMKHKK